MPRLFDLRQSLSRSATSMIGSIANETADSILSKTDSSLAKLYEDRNVQLAGGGNIAVNGTATSVSFSSNLYLHINSKIVGGSPVLINLGSGSASFTSDGSMMYATINRAVGSVVVTYDSATLPTMVAANSEVFLIAKRIGTNILFREGTVVPAGRTITLGAPDIYGSLGSSDAVLIRTNGSDGKTIQGSGIGVDGSNNMTNIASAVIGNTVIDGSAILQADSSTKGFLAPRMTGTQRDAISTPATGLLIYNTTTTNYNYYNGSSWITMGGTGTVTSFTDNSGLFSVANSTTTPTTTYASQTANKVLASPDGSSGSPSFRSLVAGDFASNLLANSKLAQMAANTIKGNNTGSTANVADLSVSQVLTMLGIVGTTYEAPTYYNLTNLSAITGYLNGYIRVGNILVMGGFFNTKMTTVNVATSFEFEIPSAGSFNNFGSFGQVAGICVELDGPDAQSRTGCVSAVVGTKRIKIKWQAYTSGMGNLYYVLVGRLQ